MNGSEIVVTFLGTGSAIPPNGRQQSSAALRHPHGLVLFDCGEGTQFSLRELGVSTRKEVVITVSHLHSDHFLGLPGLLSSFQLLGRTEPIVIIGPPGIARTLKNMMITFFIRVEYKISIHEISPINPFAGEGYTLSAVNAIHQANAMSYIWTEDEIPGKVDQEKLKEFNIPPGPLIGKMQRGDSIVVDGRIIQPDEVIGKSRRGRCVIYSGDTAYNEELVAATNSCDLLIHEATYPSDMTDLAEERSHTTVKQAAVLAKKMQVEKLILTHLSPRIRSFEDELLIAKTQYENVEFAKRGLEIIIPYLYHD